MADIKLIRVDYRLIHGQVVAKWLKVSPVRRIVLVDDVLGNDEFMSDIYKMAVPKGTAVDIVTVNKAKSVLDQTSDTVFLILKDIDTCCRVIDKGVEILALNVGAVPNEQGRKLITSGVAISPKELEQLEELETKGIEITVQPIPEIAALSFDAVKKKM
ncbi:MAG TPA: PTS sugar transporter subunit IIB [Candidatus Anaerostipes excrementavium]|uniref:PTS sugar transporter subunit IIB n=1 Tax=Candidatus Anaerostipes excrementavium TaxID=2838463 RepID=A0A9D2B931_9FIRM|nr:PTS sugar transporter subunit IIB [uncultured Anaerostipes sp.]HIX67556.1 PTS sugar transporter subunit IIB [Candidatus Anaerostipes excrementavium]